jgi:MOSC domain-containing protein YiiM
MSGRLIGIARARELRAPLEEVEEASVSECSGIEGDARGIKRGRQVTILFRDGWEDACRELDTALPWVTRRANLYVEGLERPRMTGGRIRIGNVVLAVAQETKPCELMERAHKGLRRALAPDWRGGVCCDVVQGGQLQVGEAVILSGASPC